MGLANYASFALLPETQSSFCTLLARTMKLLLSLSNIRGTIGVQVRRFKRRVQVLRYQLGVQVLRFKIGVQLLGFEIGGAGAAV